MTRGWEKSLLFKILVGLFLFLFCVQCVNASEIGISRDFIDVDFLFNDLKGTVYTKSEDFTITNYGNDTFVEIQPDSPGIINPNPSSFSLDAGQSKDITLLIKISSKDEERT